MKLSVLRSHFLAIVTATAIIPLCSVYANTNPEKIAQMTYDRYCKTCHAPMIASALKAPAFDDAKAWDERFKTAEKMAKQDPKKYPTALDYLVSQVKNGIGAMPPGGMCIGSDGKMCKDDIYRATITYMSARNKKKQKK